MATDQNLDILIRADASGVKSGMDSAKDSVQSANAAIANSAKQMADATKAAAAQVAAAQAQVSSQTKEANAGMSASLKEHTTNMAASFKGMTESMQSGFGGLSGAIGFVTKHFAALAAVVAGVGVFKEGIEESKKFTSEANKLGKALGITATEASTLNVALGDVYSDADTFISASQMLSRQLRTNEESLQKMGITTRDSSGEYRNMKDIMMDSINVLKDYKEGTDRNLAAQTLFGRGAGDVTALMKLNNEVMDAAKQKQEELGLIVGVENVEATKNYKAAMNDVGDVMSALKKTIGDAVMPVFTKLGEWLAAIGPAAVTILKGAIGGLTTVFWALKNGVVVVWETINAMVVTVTEPLRAVASAMGKALQGDWAGAKAEITGMGGVISNTWGGAMDEMVKSSEETAKQIGDLFGKPTAIEDKGPAKGKSYVDPKEKEKKAKDTTDPIMKGFEAELSEMKQAYQEAQRIQGSFHEFSREQEVAYWEGKRSLVEAGSNEEKTIRKKVADLKLAIDKEAFQTEIETEKAKYAGFERNAAKKLELETALLAKMKAAYGEDSKEYQAQLKNKLSAEQQASEQRRRIANEIAQRATDTRLGAIEEELADAQHQVALGAATNAQLIELERGHEERKIQIRREALAVKKAEVDPDRDPEAYARINSQIEELETGHKKRMSALDRKENLERTANYRGVMSTIQSGFAQTFAQVMKGQMTLSGAVKSMFKTVVGAVIDMLAQMAAKFLMTKIMEVTIGKTAAMANIQQQAAAAGAGGVASMAAAPFPISLGAPAFGAAMFGAAEAFGAAAAAPGFAVGAWNIPDDGITKVHKGETILNATDAENFRNVREGSGSGGGAMHFHINALDGADVRRVLMDNGGNLVKSLKNQARNFKGLTK